jgi:hypothetical protein
MIFLEQINRRNCRHAETLLEQRSGDHPTAEEKVMPALLWVVFWSSLMATAVSFGESFGEMSRAVSLDKRDDTDGRNL